MSASPFFNIVAEAKMGALIIMTHRQHPEWSRAEVAQFLIRILEFCCTKDFGDDI